MLIERKEYLDTDGSVGYIEAIFDSTNILRVTFFPKSERLYIAFSRGNTYSYPNFTEKLYTEFEECESQGKFFNTKINRNKNHPSRKEFTLYPTELLELKEIVKNKIDDDD